MTELPDYSGGFDPAFSLDRFSREMLANLLKTYAEYMRRVDGYWYLTVKEKWDNEEAFKCDLLVWERAKVFEMKTLCELLHIRGDDVAAMMKFMQVSPWVWPYENRMELIDARHGIFTKCVCPTLYALEEEGESREEVQCHRICPKGLEFIANFFNPAIKLRALDLPPRQDRSGICCRWEFKLEE